MGVLWSGGSECHHWSRSLPGPAPGQKLWPHQQKVAIFFARSSIVSTCLPCFVFSPPLERLSPCWGSLKVPPLTPPPLL